MIPDDITENDIIPIIEDLLAWELSEYNYEGLKEFFFYTKKTYYFSNPTGLEDMLAYRKEYLDSAPVDPEMEDGHKDHYRPTKEVLLWNIWLEDVYSKGSPSRQPSPIID